VRDDQPDVQDRDRYSVGFDPVGDAQRENKTDEVSVLERMRVGKGVRLQAQINFVRGRRDEWPESRVGLQPEVSQFVQG
jgi:hypothetical protein